MSTPVVTRWWWIRHAPVVGTHGKVYGQMDVDCDVSDVASFKALAQRVPDGALWITTPLSRTQRTARAIGEQIKAAGRPQPPAFTVEPAFLEQSFGEWQGRTYREIGAYGQSPEAHRFWLAPAVATPPGGESFESVVDRVGARLSVLSREHAGRDVVVVSHGGAIRAAVAHAIGLHPENALALSIDTLSLTRLDHIEGPGKGHNWRLGLMNWPAP
ncbi:MAG: histidine phosphatase family protein [Alphaproteobacteria bacterium]|nr:histidine phosphatase family protein [Alphaproteobacteria bacterium]